VKLTFDLMIPKISSPCPVNDLCQLATKLVYLFTKYRVHTTGDKSRDEQMSR